MLVLLVRGGTRLCPSAFPCPAHLVHLPSARHLALPIAARGCLTSGCGARDRPAGRGFAFPDSAGAPRPPQPGLLLIPLLLVLLLLIILLLIPLRLQIPLLLLIPVLLPLLLQIPILLQNPILLRIPILLQIPILLRIPILLQIPIALLPLPLLLRLLPIHRPVFPSLAAAGAMRQESPRSVNIVAFGNERDGFSEDNQQPSLIWSYLGRSALISQINSSLSASHVGNPVFTEYHACVFGNVRLVVHDCPVWDIFDSDWYTSCRLIGGADIIVIKYSVNDKTSFQELKDSYVPMVKKALNHCSVPVIISAIGARKNGVPCTCPLCTSDRRSCVTTSEGVQLAKELGATYLELHTLNDFYIQKYFGGVLEYFMIQSLNQKSSEKMKKRKKTQKCHRVQPPQLEQPEKMPILKGEASHYNADLHNLLCCCQCADVAFYPEDLSTVVEAHKIILCSVSHLFMLLFGVKSPCDTHDTSVAQLAQSLFAVQAGDPFPSSPRGVPPCVPPVRVVVKDSVFCSCLPDILHFIYSGAFQWERLEEDIRKKLKDPDKTEHVLEKVKCILKTPGKLNTVKDCKSHQIKQLYNTSLRLFFNTPVLADVIFKIQGATVPAHRAVLVARCEVMAAMFNGNYLEANSIQVPVYGVSKDTFLSFLEYLYTDSCCPASILQAMSLLICAEMYQVMRLQHICELYIITQLQSMPSRELASTSLSIVSLLQKAKFHNSDCLSTWLLHFIATNYLIFSQKPEFQELSVEERNFVEMHRWPSNLYLKQLADYRNYIHSQKCHCTVIT